MSAAPQNSLSAVVSSAGLVIFYLRRSLVLRIRSQTSLIILETILMRNPYKKPHRGAFTRFSHHWNFLDILLFSS